MFCLFLCLFVLGPEYLERLSFHHLSRISRVPVGLEEIRSSVLDMLGLRYPFYPCEDGQ